jgi:hypothetical protein
MDSAMAGGGWTMVMKAAAGSTTFPYSSTHWTTTSTLNGTSTDTSAQDAKFEVFNSLEGTEVLAVFPDVNLAPFGNTERGSIDGQNYGWTWRSSIPNAPKTALTLFNGSQQSLGDPRAFSGWNSAVFSSQSGFKWYGFNYVQSGHRLNVRWGFGWNNENDQGSNDVTGGIGLSHSSAHNQNAVMSAGDRVFCCASSTGLNRSMAVQVFVR